MDEFKFIYNAWKTSIELARDRDYVIDEVYNKITETDFKYILQNEPIKADIICKTHKKYTNKILYVKFVHMLKIKPSTIKEILKSMQSIPTNKSELELIIILKSKPNNTIIKLEKEYPYMQIMWCKQLQFNISKHEYVPKHELLSVEDGDKILERYSLTSRQQLPIMLKNDAVARYYNYKSGDIIKITQTNTSHSMKYDFYRCVN